MQPTMPAVPTPPTPQQTSTPQFYIDSVAGQTYGPVTQAELNSWVQQGRVTADCIIRQSNLQTGMAASAYFPSLGQSAGSQPNTNFSAQPAKPGNPFAGAASKQPGASSANPYGAPMSSATRRPQGRGIQTGRIAPVEADLGRIFSIAWDVFKANMGLLIGALCTLIPFNMVDSFLSGVQEAGVQMEVMIVVGIGRLFISLITTYLGIGVVIICLKLVRGQAASYGDLFSAGTKIFPIIGYYISFGLIPIPLVMLAGFTGSPIFLIAAGLFALILIPLSVVIWPVYSLIADSKATLFESYGLAFSIGSKNVLNSIVLFFATMGLVIAGFLAFCVGLLFTVPFISVIWVTAYLVMSGQVR
ncbi:MAG: hypothetical protein AB8B55_02220 [Mariniblastus sp.]